MIQLASFSRSSASRCLAAFALCAAAASITGCGAEGDLDEDGQNFTSANATLLVFEFDGQLLTATNSSLSTQVKAQLFYTVGQLNAVSSVARLDKLQLVSISSAAAGGGLYKVSYHAKLPVAWGSLTNLPTSFSLHLPRRADASGLLSFFNLYQATCAEQIGDEITGGNFWFHFRPLQAGCALNDTYALTANAAVSVSTQNTKGKYPEYHLVWQDRTLRVVAVFGKYAKGDTDESDAGIAAFDAFVTAVRARLPAAAVTPAFTGPAGVAHPDVTIEMPLANGRTAVITALLVDEVRTASAAFQKRYADLTPGADLIVYNGHAGLGSNIAALQTMGNFFPGKYQIAFFDGCDTFAYLDDTLARRRAVLNPDDPTGTKYLDIVTNAMPAYFDYMPAATMAMLNALLDDAHPKTYQSIFQDIAADHVVLATNEEDNVYTPGMAAAPWSGSQGPITEVGFVGKSESVLYTTETLPAGKYVFELIPGAAFPGGDSDLRVRAGAAPDLTQTYKCKSYVANSNERCAMTLAAPAKVFMTVTGDATGVESHYELRTFMQ